MSRRRRDALRWAALAGLAALALAVLWPEAPPGPTGTWLAEAGLSPREETVEGVRVRYVLAGDGPPLVLLHGLASSLYTWKDVLPTLARRHRVLAPDLPGFGASGQPPDLDWGLYPRVVSGLMDRVGLERAALVGHSMGGAVSAVLAGERPTRVARLVLVDSAGFNLRPAERPFLLRLAAAPGAHAVLERLPVRRALVRLGLRQVFHDDALVTPQRVDEYLAPLWRPGAAASLRSLLLSADAAADRFEEALARVEAPTLILWGREDSWAPVAHADRFAAALPGARKVVFDACGHMPQEERPAETVRLLLEFLSAEP